MPPEKNKKIILAMNEAFNQGDQSAVDRHGHKQLRDHTPWAKDDKTGVKDDKTGVKDQMRILKEAFPDAKYTIEQMVAEGESVAFRWKMVGTHSGNLLGHAPTNSQVEHYGQDIVIFKDGKMAEHYSADNIGDLLGKLGLPVRVQDLPKEV